MNSRLDELQAALLRARLAWIEKFNGRRREIAERYHAEICNPAVQLMAKPVDDAAHVHHLFVARSLHRDYLQRWLEGRGVQTLIHYPLGAHQQQCLRTIRCDPAGLRASEEHARQCISLPIHPMMEKGEIDCVIEAVNDFRV